MVIASGTWIDDDVDERELSAGLNRPGLIAVVVVAAGALKFDTVEVELADVFHSETILFF